MTQLFAIPVFVTMTEFLGCTMAVASSVVYGKVEWNPLVVINQFDYRAGKFFAGALFVFFNIMTNVTGNSIPLANDLTGLFPKYINIRRGQLLAAFIGAWACVPWKILASAARFLAFLSGYTIFLGPMTAILITDYYITRRGNVSVPDMYDFHGIYRYSAKYATNWRAIAALVVGFAPPLPGFISNIVISQQVDPNPIVAAGGQHLFAIGYIYSFIAAGVFYWGFMRFFPEQGSRIDHPELGEDIVAANDQSKLAASKA